MGKKLGPFALTGQGLGSRAKKGNVALGGRPNADDQKNAVNFQAGKMTSSAASKSNPRMDQKPAKTKASSKGVSGTALPVGRASPTTAVTRNLKNASKGAKSGLPLGKPSQTSAVASSLKNAK